MKIKSSSWIFYSLVIALGFIAFAFPFVWHFHQSPNSAHSYDAPMWSALLAFCVVGAIAYDLNQSKISGVSIALVGVLSALVGILRVIDLPVGGRGMFFLLIIVGYSLGPRAGLLVGMFGMFVSAAFTGGLGPWLPFQALASALVGSSAGFLGIALKRFSKPKQIIGLIAFAWLAAFIFGGLTDLWFWPVTVSQGPLSWSSTNSLTTNLHHFWRFYVSTSLVWDSAGAFTNAILVAIAAPILLESFSRVADRINPAVRIDSVLVTH